MEAVETLRPHRLARFMGAAGTGKSTVAIRLPELLGLGERVVFATPSHTARRVLEEKARDEGIEIRTATLASLLWGPPTIAHCPACPPSKRPGDGHCPCLVLGGDGCPYAGVDGADYCGRQEHGAAGVGSKPFWRDWDSVIVDESSMVSKKDFDALMAGREHLSGRLIFTGDICQLPSVDDGAKGWSALSEPMPEAKLTKIRRTEPGPIIAGAAHFRRLIDPQPGEEPARGGSVAHFREVAFASPAEEGGDPEKATYVYDFPADQAGANAMLARWGNAMRLYSGHVDGWEEYTVLASTNKHRMEWNRQVRLAAGRGEAPEEGDVLMAADQIGDITKWSRGVVRDATPGLPGCNMAPEGRWAKKGAHRACWFVDIEVPGYGDGGAPLLLRDQHVTWEALNTPAPAKGAAPGWIWGFARTVHTAQGDAFSHVIMHDSEWSPKGEPLAVAKRIYTAVTRARKSVTIVPSRWDVPTFRPVAPRRG